LKFIKKQLKGFWESKSIFYLCSPKIRAASADKFIKENQAVKFICSTGDKAEKYSQQNILSNEKDISTIKKTQKKQAWFQKENGICQRTQSSGSKKGKRKKETHCV
jgi:hypothetical protein